MPRDTITPMEIERRLLELTDELDEAQDLLREAEATYAKADHANRMAQAEARLNLQKGERRTTEQQRKDEALVLCKAQDWELAMADATVRSARNYVYVVRTKVDIARSLGTSVRSSMELV